MKKPRLRRRRTSRERPTLRAVRLLRRRFLFYRVPAGRDASHRRPAVILYSPAPRTSQASEPRNVSNPTRKRGERSSRFPESRRDATTRKPAFPREKQSRETQVPRERSASAFSVRVFLDGFYCRCFTRNNLPNVIHFFRKRDDEVFPRRHFQNARSIQIPEVRFKNFTLSANTFP